MRRRLACAALLGVAACTTKPANDISASRQLAELNHVFATVDPATAQAIRGSEFLRRFANLEVRTTTGTRATWTGRYLYGRQTYIEFFAPEDFHIDGGPAPVGAWGIALSGDSVGFNAALARRLLAAGYKSFTEIETRKFGERDVPWFEALTAITQHGDSGALNEAVTIWAMEYQPSYFDLPEVGKEPAEHADDAISRERYLSDGYATKMMRDVVEVHFNVGPDDFARVEPLLRAAGYRINRSAHEAVADGDETDFRFNLVAPAAQGLRQVRFSLNAPVKRQVEAIGSSTLVVGPDATATWTFEAPPIAARP
jgi:hypothetical protein